MIYVLGILVVGVLLLEMILISFALKNSSRARLVKESPFTHVGKIGPGPVKVVGQAVAITGALHAPLSGKSCVYYSFQVQERRSRAGPPFPG